VESKGTPSKGLRIFAQERLFRSFRGIDFEESFSPRAKGTLRYLLQRLNAKDFEGYAK
jgi:hypothetical protein